MAAPCETPDPTARIRHHNVAITRRVPVRLDWLAWSATDCLDLVARRRLGETLEPNLTPCRHGVQELRCPMSRIREAASRIPNLAAKSPALTACQTASARARGSGP